MSISDISLVLLITLLATSWPSMGYILVYLSLIKWQTASNMHMQKDAGLTGVVLFEYTGEKTSLGH